MNITKLGVIILLLLFILAFRFISITNNQPQYDDNQSVRFIATVREQPEIKKSRQRIRVQTPHGVDVMLFVPVLPVFRYGDRLLISGVFTKNEYDGRIFWSMYYPKLQTLEREHNIFTESAVFIKSKAQSLFESSLPPLPAALLSGILFGGRHGMPEDFLEALRTTGVLHVIAASGANVAFVAGALLVVLGRIMRRQYALCIGIAGITFYAFLAGFEPSIVRAAIMGSVAFGAAIMGRANVSIVALCLTGYVMLLVDPWLLSDVGFQLSFLATLGILVVKPVLDGLLEQWGKLRGLADDITTTTAAQVGVVPVLLGTFGQFSLLSVLANALILWTIPIVMVFGAVGLLAGMVFEPLGKLIVLLCLPFLWLFEWIVRGVGEVGVVWGMVSVEEFPWVLGVGYYLLVLAVVLFLRKRQGQRANRQKSLREEIGI